MIGCREKRLDGSTDKSRDAPRAPVSRSAGPRARNDVVGPLLPL